MWRLMLAVLLTGAMLSSTAHPAVAGTVLNLQEPVSGYGRSCDGEGVALSGRQHVLLQVTEDAAGGRHVTGVLNDMGVNGVGTTTGRRYRLVLASIYTFESTTDGLVEHTAIMHAWMIGQGAAEDWVVEQLFRYTVAADGEVTGGVSRFTAECRG